MFEIVFGVFAAVFALIFLAVGVIALVGGAQQKKRCSASAPGVVSSLHCEVKEQGKRKLNIYTPEFQFETGGNSYTLRANFGSMKREFTVGQAVTIRFDPADPRVAYVADDQANSSQGGFMLLSLGLLLAIGAVLLFT